jgi:hypothetical protein
VVTAAGVGEGFAVGLNGGSSFFETGSAGSYFSGNVGIGTTNPGQKLTVAGSVGLPGIANGAGTAYVCTTLATGVLSTSTTACNPSSLRFKDNVQDLPYGLDDVLKLKPVSFTYKPELKVPGNQVGFIAEDVVQVVPEVVGLDAEGRPTNVDYAKVVPLLVNAIKDLASKLTDLASTVASFAQSFTTKELIATNITAHRVTADELCAKDDAGVPVCVTGIQLRSLLSGSVLGASAANDNDPPTEAEPPAEEPADAINATASSTPPVAADAETSSPANDNEASTTLPATEPSSAAQ